MHVIDLNTIKIVLNAVFIRYITNSYFLPKKHILLNDISYYFIC
jgi:hypothetical protein